MVLPLPQPADCQGRWICDGKGRGLQDVLGGGVPECDGVCRHEDANAAAGSCARGNAHQGVAAVAGAVASWTSSLQGSSVQLLRLSRKGRAANKHDSATGQGSAVFRVVMDRGIIWTETSSPKDGVRLTTWEAKPKEMQVVDASFWHCS